MKKAQQDKLDRDKQMEEQLKQQHRNELRQQYFDMQRKNIDDFRMQKEATESLFMIKGPMMGMD